METYGGENVVKQIILKEVAKSIKTIFARSSSSTEVLLPLSISSQLVTSIDHALHHGLVNISRGFWPLVSSFSHVHTVHTVDQWVGTQGSARSRGQAWLLATLVEGSLQSYLECVIADSQVINRFYSPAAIMRDSDCLSQFCSLLRGLETIPFRKAETFGPSEEAKLFQTTKSFNSINKSSLNLSFDDPSTPSASTTLTMTSSRTSSLASPGDSGFTQLDSETDTASFSENCMAGDSSSIKEEAAGLPNDTQAEKIPNTLFSYHEQIEPMTASDIANGNTSSVAFNTSLNCDDDLVYRRPKHSKGKLLSSKHQKRVSFHENTPNPSDNAKNGEEVNILKLVHDTYTPNKAEKLLDSLKMSSPSLSCAITGVSSLAQEQDGVEIGKDTSILCSNGLTLDVFPDEVILLSQGESTLRELLKPKESGSIIETMKTILSGSSLSEKYCKVPEERGMPEGQEDPPLKCQQNIGNVLSPDSDFFLNNCNTLYTRGAPSPVPSCSSLKPQFSSPHHMPNKTNSNSARLVSRSSILNQTPSKACLVNRFLRSITEKKLSNHRLAAAISAVEMRRGIPSLYIPGVKPVHTLSKEILLELEVEISKAELKSQLSETRPRGSLDLTLFNHLLFSPAEIIYKVVDVQSSLTDSHGKRIPLFAVVTDQALHVCNNKFIKQISVQHSQISSFLVSPCSQWIMLRTLDGSASVFVCAETDGPATLISSIEFMLRKKRSMSFSLPAVIQMSLKDVSVVSSWMPALQKEHVHYYSVVHAMEENFSPPSAPLCPTKKAHFMYKINKGHGSVAWEPGFFVLKAGVLYLFSDEGEGAPYMINLKGVYASFVHIASRPHTIEVGCLHIAAPDNYVASDWLQALHMCSSGVYDVDPAEMDANFVSGSLLVTDSRLLLLPFLGTFWEPQNSLKPLLTGYLSDVASLSIGDHDCCWCIVELSCREVRASGGDYIMFFNSYESVLSFTKKIWELHPSLKEVTRTMTENEPLRQQCEKVASKLLMG